MKNSNTIGNRTRDLPTFSAMPKLIALPRIPNIIIIIIIIGIQPLGRSGQRPEFSQATGMALVRCILGKFLGGSLPLLSPRFLDVPTFHHQVPPRPPRRKIS